MEKLLELSKNEFAEKIFNDKLAIIIDVRTPEEFFSGHIPNSLLIDFYHPNFQKKILELPKDKNYYLYCRSGNRSFYAGNFMLQNGFDRVHHLKDGIIYWDKTLETQ